MIDRNKFNNKKLFDQAFVHRSYLNETKEDISSNERLEFLGDSIISFVVSKHLFITYPQYNEGILTNLRALLVNTKSLALLAKELNFGEYLMLSKGEEESKGRQNQSLLADCFEGYVGALFIDQGIEETINFLHGTLIPKLEEIEKNRTFKDPKSLLQEYVQSRRLNSPLYKVLEELGPAHARSFTIGAFVNNKKMGEGTGRSKREAEEQAAQNALNFIKQEKLLRKAS